MPDNPDQHAESVARLREAIIAQKEACRYAPPTAQEWSEGYEAALGWVLFRLEGTCMTDALRDAATRLLAAWDAEDEQELNDLGEELWAAVRALRAALIDGMDG